MKHLKNAQYLLRHKWFVFYAGLKTGAPLWRLIVHDWSKLSAAEWSGYANFFWGTKDHEARSGFRRSWLHHIHHNPHHWQYWIIPGKDTGALKMPEKFVREMVADWAGAGRAITGKWEFRTWYPEQEMNLHKDTRREVEMLIADLNL